MDFYDGFTWAVPKAFKDAIASCSFEEGDTLYCTRIAYDGAWGDVVDKIDHAIQVRFPSRSTNKKTTEDISSIFKANWNTTVKIEIIIGGGSNIDERFLHTTQGRLFTLLRSGDINILSTDCKSPEMPLLLDSLKPHLSDSRVTETINQIIDGKYEKPNLAIIAYDETNDTLVAKVRKIISSIEEFKPKEINFPLTKFEFLRPYYFHPTLTIKAIIIDSNSPEKIRDRIKEVLWPKREPKNATNSFCDVITRSKSISGNPFKLNNHLIFSPFQIKKFGDIKVHSFDHTPVYRYRLHCIKIENQKGIPKSLKNYLGLVFTDCPNHLFIKTGFRVSKIDFQISIEIEHTKEHLLINLAKESREFTKFKSRHENLEQYFLDNDMGTIAVELPLWIENGEFKDFSEIFNTNEALTGHIDLLRIEDSGKIAIWDYKPNAYKETKAHIQVFLYAYMLSVRTGIKLSDFICGYFDEIDCYQFNPSEVSIEGCKNT
jgi:hypothetical protein